MESCNICTGEVEEFLKVDSTPPLQNKFFSSLDGAIEYVRTDVHYLWCGKCQHISVRKNAFDEFDPNYINSQTHSPTAVSQYKNIIAQIENEIPNRSAKIVEIGCGRGELLDFLVSLGYTDVAGFDPVYDGDSSFIANQFWKHQDTSNADLIITRHTLEELSNPLDFIRDVTSSLKVGGYFYSEVANAPYLLANNDVFALFPEYYNIFSAYSITNLFSRYGLSVDKIEKINNGEWLGVWGKKDGHSVSAQAGLKETIASKFRQLPKPIVIWGAAGRGGNILAFLQLPLQDVQFVVDINPLKQGMFIPPYGQTVVSEKALSQIAPRTIVVANRKYLHEVEKLAPENCKVIAISDLPKHEI